jgi:VCBS repeat protein
MRCLCSHALSLVPRLVLRRKLGPACVLLCVIAFTGLTSAQGLKFNSPVTYPAGSPYVITSGDLNGDGKIDLIAGDVNHTDVVVLLGNGDGSLNAPLTYHLGVAPYYLATADFNRDGKLDVATVNPNAANISILFGKGDGTFEAAMNYPVGRFPSYIRTGDFNRDGWVDIAVLGGNNDLQVLINRGDGTFKAPVGYALSPSPGALAVGDFNGDGKLDLVIPFRQLPNKTVATLLGNGDGTFQMPLSSSTAQNGTGPYNIAVGDFDRDGKLDVAMCDENLKILKGNGDGTFKMPTVNILLRNTSPDMKVSDLNGDGRLDVITSGVFNGRALQIFLGGGDGTFQDAGDLIPGSSSLSVVVTDLNGDTRPDLIANINSQLTVSLVNTTPGNVDNTDYFVHQQYVDFLEREPDAEGFGFWSNEITSCGSDPTCLQTKRINVSAAFYLSIEFQQTAYLVERLYKVSFGDAMGSSATNGAHQLPVPIVRLNDLLFDTQQIGENVIVRQPGWDNVLENNKQQFVNEFVRRSRFMSAFPASMTPPDFVDQLNRNSGNILSPADRTALMALFGGAADSNNISARAQVVRQVAENADLYRAEFNRAFVLMQYTGYLRRNPNEGQDSDYSGFEFWLNKLNTFNGNFVNAEMVKAFITSDEYKNRFTQ